MIRVISIVVLFLLLPLPAFPAQTVLPPEYHLSVSVVIPGSRLSGSASLRTESGKTAVFNVAKLSVRKVTLNGGSVEYDIREGKLTVKSAAPGVLNIEYEAVFKGKAEAAADTGAVQNSIDARGIVLTGTWYPEPEGPARYHLRASLPRGYEAVSEADSIEKTVRNGGAEFEFRFDHPFDHVSLIANDKYEVFRDRVNGIDVFAYFFPEDRGLAKTYLQRAGKYLEMYGKLLTKYPYKRFSIVENFLSSGVSLPTYTLLGRDVVRLPFIPETSLGHEILHQWFGNSVYVDDAQGNWSEGLTTYLSDHWYEDQAGRGWQYRKQLLIEYDSSVSPQNEISLRQFRGRIDRASKAVGYNKAAMVFHMLRRSLGDEAFFDGLRAFIESRLYQAASWDDIRAAFEKKSGKDLAGFFTQWVDQKGLPRVKTAKASVFGKGDSFEIGLAAQEEPGTYTLDLPADVRFIQDGAARKRTTIDAEKKELTLSVDREPRSIALDGDYDVARKLTDGESPPVLAALLADRKPVVVLPVSNREAYAPVVAGFKESGGDLKEAAGLTDAVIKNSSLAVLGADNPVIGRLFGRIEDRNAGFGITARKNPWNPEKVIVLISARSAAEAAAAFPKISHYGLFSSLDFEQGRNVSKTLECSQRGITMDLRQPATAIDLSTLKTLTDTIRAAAEKKIVYVGEYHDKFAHHLVELQVIQGLYEQDPRLAIGMEMFQRPFQKVIDDYIGGVIDERAFLKGTEYFKRWVFDYNLYKPILDFARSRKIRVLALNQKQEITDKVAREGLDSLTDEERKQVPDRMDFSDDQYRDRLKAVFEQHKSDRSFEFFYQAQVLWDETMAETANEFLQKNPDERLVVVAGGGHLAYGSGIPKRCHRRNGIPYFIVLNDADADKDTADYLVLPQSLEGTEAPRLMAVLNAQNNRVKVTEFPPDSVSKKAGIETGDTILSIDNEKVESVEDVMLVLFYRKHGDVVNVKVVRKRRFLLGDREMEFKVTL